MLYSQMSNASRTVIVAESLDNRTVLVRRSAVADVYFSSEAFDDYGPKSDIYYGYLGVYPDEGFWRIVEFADDPEAVTDEFHEDFVSSVLSELEAMSPDVRGSFLDRATSIEWQLTSGEVRAAVVDSDEEVADAFDVFGLGDPHVDILEDRDFFHVNVEGCHRSVFINARSVEWIAVPTHRLKRGTLSEAEDLVDGPLPPGSPPP